MGRAQRGRYMADGGVDASRHRGGLDFADIVERWREDSGWLLPRVEARAELSRRLRNGCRQLLADPAVRVQADARTLAVGLSGASARISRRRRELLSGELADRLAEQLPQLLAKADFAAIRRKSDEAAVTALAAVSARALAGRSREALRAIFAQRYQLSNADGAEQVAGVSALEDLSGETRFSALVSLMGEEEWAAFLSDHGAARTPGSALIRAARLHSR